VRITQIKIIIEEIICLSVIFSLRKIDARRYTSTGANIKIVVVKMTPKFKYP